MAVKVSFAQYARGFSKPFRFGDKTLAVREGILLRCESVAGVLYSEAAPLPGYSHESIADILSYLHNFGPALDTRAPPSLRFALSAFSIDSKFKPLKSNALVQALNREQFHGSFAHAIDRGYEVVKIKVNPENLSWVLAELDDLGGEARIRLDANRSLSKECLFAFANFIHSHERLRGRIEYLEEPCPAAWKQEFLRDFPLQIAADESVCNAEDMMRALEAPRAPDLLILKPGLLGSAREFLDLVGKLDTRGVPWVATSALETEVGRRNLLALLGGTVGSRVCGLSTGNIFEESYLEDRPIFFALPEQSKNELDWLNSLLWTDLS